MMVRSRGRVNVCVRGMRKIKDAVCEGEGSESASGLEVRARWWKPAPTFTLTKLLLVNSDAFERFGSQRATHFIASDKRISISGQVHVS